MMKNLSTYGRLLFVVLLCSRCGIDSSRHYDNDKDFGREKTQDLTETPPEKPPVVVSEPPPVETTNEELPTEHVEEPPTSSGHDLLGHYGLVGYFDSSSVARIIRSHETDGEIIREGLLAPVIKKIFEMLTRDDTNERLDIVTQENGHERQAVSQIAHTATGDFLAELIGDNPQSGTQTLDWALAKADEPRECPNPFICVDRIIWQPEVGETSTYCFRDPISKESAAIPYSPNTQFGPEAFAAALPSGSLLSKPFLMTKHSGAVLCDNAGEALGPASFFQWQVTLGDLKAAREPGFLKKAQQKPLTPDSEILIEFKPYRRDPSPRLAAKRSTIYRSDLKVQHGYSLFFEQPGSSVCEDRSHRPDSCKHRLWTFP